MIFLERKIEKVLKLWHNLWNYWMLIQNSEQFLKVIKLLMHLLNNILN